jgi:predicted nucleic acid-binding protein
MNILNYVNIINYRRKYYILQRHNYVAIKECNHMDIKEYLLDANIVINIWNKYPGLFKAIENAEGIDYKISRPIAEELSIKEFKQVGGVPVLSSKFLELLDHIIEEEDMNKEEKSSDVLDNNIDINTDIKYDARKDIYYVDGNKISGNDYRLMEVCRKNKNYILVTEDRNLYTSAKSIIENPRVITFKEFIGDLEESNVI